MIVFHAPGHDKENKSQIGNNGIVRIKVPTFHT